MSNERIAPNKPATDCIGENCDEFGHEPWECPSLRAEGGEVISRAQYADRRGDADERKTPGNCPTCGRPFDEGDS